MIYSFYFFSVISFVEQVESPYLGKSFKLHKCVHCPYTTVRSNDMQKHQVKHTGALPFSCPFCGKLFPYKSSLHNHVKYVHS